jgi:hypothetical protein
VLELSVVTHYLLAYVVVHVLLFVFFQEPREKGFSFIEESTMRQPEK